MKYQKDCDKRKIQVTVSSLPEFEEYIHEIQDLWSSRWLTNMGAKQGELRVKLQDYLSVKHMELFTNGHLSIELALQAMGLTGEVITTPFTFASTTQAIVRSGLTPVFCDIDPVAFCMDPAKIEPLITENTAAILPVHVYGNVCDVEAMEDIARRHNLKVIYDAAHTFGVRFKGRGIAGFGDVSCFSFHATKVFHTIEGGAACFHDTGLGKRLAELRNFGMANPETVAEVGTNAKMDEFRAAMGLCNLRYIDQEIAKRKRIAARYREWLEDVPGIQLNPIQPNVTPNYAYFPAVFDESVFGVDRDEIQRTLMAQDIHARKYFYPLTSEFSCYQGRFDTHKTPVAKQISRQVLTLPLYADLTLEDVDKICGLVLSCKK